MYVHLGLQFCNKPLEDGRIDPCISLTTRSSMLHCVQQAVRTWSAIRVFVLVRYYRTSTTSSSTGIGIYLYNVHMVIANV